MFTEILFLFKDVFYSYTKSSKDLDFSNLIKMFGNLESIIELIVLI